MRRVRHALRRLKGMWAGSYSQALLSVQTRPWHMRAHYLFFVVPVAVVKTPVVFLRALFEKLEG